jgi:predicted lipoprotein with Yx(FWY)xxD motif
MPRHRLLPLAAIVAATLALSACGGTGSSTDPYGSVSAPGDAAPAPIDQSVAPAAPAGGAPMLAAKDAPDLGTIVIDVDGFTLYRFDKDRAKPTPTTTCVDACAVKWPPVTVDPKGKLALEGVDKAAVGMVQRPDGTTQLTLGGWPVYRFAGDTEPGATAGQGVSGTWFAITPDGKKATGTGSGTGPGSAGGSSADGAAGDAAGSAGEAGGSAGGTAGTDTDGEAGSTSGTGGTAYGGY